MAAWAIGALGIIAALACVPSCLGARPAGMAQDSGVAGDQGGAGGVTGTGGISSAGGKPGGGGAATGGSMMMGSGGSGSGSGGMNGTGGSVGAGGKVGTGGTGSGEGEGNYALKDFIRAQILRRWLPDLTIPGARNLPVLVRLRLLKSGAIDTVYIVDQQRFITDKAFRDMALSARDAALLASPIQWPGGLTVKSQTLTITLDPKAVLR